MWEKGSFFSFFLGAMGVGCLAFGEWTQLSLHAIVWANQIDGQHLHSYLHKWYITYIHYIFFLKNPFMFIHVYRTQNITAAEIRLTTPAIGERLEALPLKGETGMLGVAAGVPATGTVATGS